MDYTGNIKLYSRQSRGYWAVQNITVQYSTVQYSRVEYSTVHSTTQYNTEEKVQPNGFLRFCIIDLLMQIILQDAIPFISLDLDLQTESNEKLDFTF